MEKLDSYAPAAYFQAVGGWKQRQAVAQLCTGSSWLAVNVVGAQSNVVVPREERVCRRCSGDVMDDAHHKVFHCVSMGSIRWNHSSLFINGPGSRPLKVFMVQKSAEVAAFVYECKKACLAMTSSVRLLQIPKQRGIYFARVYIEFCIYDTDGCSSQGISWSPSNRYLN